MAHDPSESPELSLLSPEFIRLQVNQILSSPQFAAALRSKRFLTYIVGQKLSGREGDIKEMVLGIEVFDRSGSFDPRTDAIVRVEAGKLRKRLERYYDNEGAAAPVRIEIPRGSYVPQFRLQSQLPAPLVRTSRVHRVQYTAVVGAFLAALCVWWAAWHFQHPKPPAEPSIAVLPFLNISPDAANEYLADGLAEELTDALVRAGGMRVASRTSAFYFKGRQANVEDIGAKLHVGFVVEGSVRRQGEVFKLTVQVIRANDGYHVWSGSFERELKDLFAAQQDAAASVVSALQVKLTGNQRRRLSKTHTASQRAFDLYMRGRHASKMLVSFPVESAERFYRESIAIDPNYALPQAALAGLYMNANILSDRPARDIFLQAKEAVQKALALDNELADAHAILGALTARHEYDWPAAERYLRHALELDPNSGFAHYLLAQYVLAPQGRLREAQAENRRGMELDPFSPVIAGGQPWLVYLERRYDAAIGGFRQLLAADPTDSGPLIGLGSALMAKGDFQGAGEAFQQLQRAFPSSVTLSRIGYNHGRAGRGEQARLILRQLEAEAEHKFVSPSCFAMLYAGLGDQESAFRYLEMAREQQESFMIYVGVSSFLDPLRSNPRYSVLLAELGLATPLLQKNQ